MIGINNMSDYEDWYAYELEMQQLWEEELEQINLELNTVSEYSLTQRVVSMQHTKKVLDFCQNSDIL